MAYSLNRETPPLLLFLREVLRKRWSTGLIIKEVHRTTARSLPLRGVQLEIYRKRDLWGIKGWGSITPRPLLVGKPLVFYRRKFKSLFAEKPDLIKRRGVCKKEALTISYKGGPINSKRSSKSGEGGDGKIDPG